MIDDAGDAVVPAPRRWRLRTIDPFLAVALVAFAIVRLTSVARTTPAVFPDSSGYRSGFRDFTLVSLTGGQPRPWGITAFMALWPGLDSLTFAQAVLGVVAWSFLAVEVWLLLSRTLWRRVAVVLVLLLGLVPAVVGWDAAVLSESLSISTGILSLAALLRAIRRPSGWSIALLVGLSLWFTMTRPLTLIVVLAWGGVALVLAAISPRARVAWLLGAVLLIAEAGYSYAYNQATDNAWVAVSGHSRTTAAYAYNIGFNPVGDDVLVSVRASDAPRCMIPAAQADVARHGTTVWVNKTVAECPQMETWATANWGSWWRRWLVQHPHQAAAIVRSQMSGALATPVYAHVPKVLPTSVQSLFIVGGPVLPARVAKTQSFVVLVPLLWFGAALVLLLLGWRRVGWRSRSAEFALWVTAGASLLSVVVGVLLLQTPPGESGREHAAPRIMLAATGVILVMLGADRLSARGTSDRVVDTSGDAAAAEPTYGEEEGNARATV